MAAYAPEAAYLVGDDLGVREEPLLSLMSKRLSSRPKRRAQDPGDGSVQRFGQPPAISASMVSDPVAYLEERRLLYVTQLEQIAEEAKNRGDYETAAKVYVNLLRFTSLGRIKVDVRGQLEKLMPEPDQSGLTTEQLDRILRGEPLDP